MERYKILVTPTASFGKYSDAFSRLKSAGLEVILSPYSHPLKEEELKEFISQVDGIIVGLDPITPSSEEAKLLPGYLHMEWEWIILLWKKPLTENSSS